jgi:TRAP-type C4-dicarboxylate transport system permease small subunit
MVERILQKAIDAVEYVLALAFIFAVCLNFANVVGRYGFGRVLMGSDEVEVYIMIAMTFVGAAVVTWRRRHLRMDVLVQQFPAPLRAALRAAELLLLAVIVVFVTVESTLYTARMYGLGMKSNTAEIPLWIPHGVVAFGFAVIALITLWRVALALRSGAAALRRGRGGTAGRRPAGGAGADA